MWRFLFVSILIFIGKRNLYDVDWLRCVCTMYYFILYTLLLYYSYGGILNLLTRSNIQCKSRLDMTECYADMTLSYSCLMKD